MKIGELNIDYVVDHIDHDTLNNRKENFRVIEHINNLTNRKSRNKNNKSGYRNVCCVDGKYRVQVSIDGKNTVVGVFDDVHEAGRIAEEARQKYYGEYAGHS